MTTGPVSDATTPNPTGHLHQPGSPPRVFSPAEPAGWQPLAWGLPAGWDVPVYSSDLAGWLIIDAEVQYGKRWPAAPRGLATVQEMEKQGLRPRNGLCPDALLVGPAHRNGQPIRVDWNTIDPHADQDRDLLAEHLGIKIGHDAQPHYLDERYPTRALYRTDQAGPRHAPPTTTERAADRAAAADWADQVLADPATVILEVGTVGDIEALIETPEERAALCDLAVCDTKGTLLMNTLVNPEWEPLPTADLQSQALTRRQLETALPFHHLHKDLTNLLRGRRVVCVDRARTYGVLFCELEQCVTGTWLQTTSGHRFFTGDCYGNGNLLGEQTKVLNILDSARFECARLAWSRFIGEWDNQCRPVLASRLTSRRRAADRAQATVGLLTRMAAAAPSRYRQLCGHAEDGERAGRDQQRALTTGTRRTRLAATRAAVLLRSGGWCENPACADLGYRLDLTDAGEPLLEIHHTDGDPHNSHARGGRDHPTAAVALCRNCHGLVTHGRNRAGLNQNLAVAARAAHERHLQITHGRPHSAGMALP
ncbi:hypothetical protein ACFY4C_41345 [Actinomadura viridis]|uniref:hypothetical protein n=1 Tax=Actinomadura viridis TaxID=58110 RepID=UPI0036A3D937